LLKVYEPLSGYFCDIDETNEDARTCPPIIKEFFSSDVAKCTLYFLHNVLLDIQTKNLELQRYYISIANLHRIITTLLKKLNDRLDQNYFGHNTRLLLNSMSNDKQEQVKSSFRNYLSSIINYINKYYIEHAPLAETLSIFGIFFMARHKIKNSLFLGLTEINQITFDQIEKCLVILNLELDSDKLFEEIISLQATFKEVNSYREPLFVQIEKYVADHGFEEQIIDEKLIGPDNEEEFLHKTTTQDNQDNYHKIRPDQLWAYLIKKTSTSCEQMTKLISYVYSIPCSNAFTEGVFSHMKHAWTAS
jgi:hypothetical protein